MKVASSETRGPRPGWLVLFIALAIVLITVWFREGDSGAIHRIRVGVQTVAAPISAAGEFTTRPIRGLFAWASDLGVSRSELQQLRDQNDRLRARVAALEEAKLENVRLRDLLRLAQVRDLESVGARVIGRPSSEWEGVITIDRGSADGIRAGMPVLGPQGLLGQTVQVAPGSAKVRLITDQRSGVAAKVQRSRAEGIVKGSIDGRLTLDFVSVETTVKPGDVVITSGIGGVYPKGIVIGDVTEVRNEANALFQFIRLKPAGSLGGLEDVLVLIGEPAVAAPGGGE